jgi:sugar phosphate isomerase/epimerase
VRKDQIALQLYTVRSKTQDDFLGTLKAVAEMGYPAVEFAGFGGLAATDLRRSLDELGLRASGAHVGLDQFANNLSGVVADLHALGTEWAIVPWMPPERRGDVDQARWLAQTFNEWGARCKEEGIRFAYHNHDFEFNPLPGEQPTTMWEIFLHETDPSVVSLELDIYWAAFAGVDPLPLIRQHADRFPLLHVKDMSAAADRAYTAAGDGVIDWPPILQAAEATAAWYVVEHDNPPDPLGDSERALRYLEGLARE